MSDAVLDRSYRALFAVPAMRRLLLGMTIARLANSMVTVAVILFSLTRYGSPALTGLVTFASLIPGMLCSPIAGALLDRHGRTRLVIADYVLTAIALGMIWLLDVLDLLPFWVLLIIVAISSLTSPLSNSGLRTLLPVLVPRHLWQRANVIDSNAFVIAQLVGPPLAGVLIGLSGGDVAFGLIAVFYGLAAVATIGIPDPATEGHGSGRLLLDAWRGLTYTARNATLRGLALAFATARLGSGVLAIIVPVIVLDRLHAGPAVVGVAWGLSAVAQFVVAILTGRFESEGRERSIIAVSLAAGGSGLALLLLPPSVPLVLLATFATGALNAPSSVTMFTLRQRRTDPAWMGRAFAVSMAVSFAGYPIGSAIAGAVAEWSLAVPIIFGVATCVLAGAMAWVMIPAVVPDQEAAPAASPT